MNALDGDGAGARCVDADDGAVDGVLEGDASGLRSFDLDGLVDDFDGMPGATVPVAGEWSGRWNDAVGVGLVAADAGASGIFFSGGAPRAPCGSRGLAGRRWGITGA